jgi:hypothetical protein
MGAGTTAALGCRTDRPGAIALTANQRQARRRTYDGGMFAAEAARRAAF